MLDKICKETEKLTLKEQLELLEKLTHQLKEKVTIEKTYLDWNKLYGLGKGLWEDEDAQEYVAQLREDIK